MDYKVSAETLRNVVRISHGAIPLEIIDRVKDIASALAHQAEIDADRDAKYQALQDIGASAAESIAEMAAALECDYDRLEELRDMDPEEYAADPELQAEAAELRKAAGDCESREDAEQRLLDDPLSVEVRCSEWHALGDEPGKPGEFCILLSTGGPATRIIGELNEHCEPTRARLQAQDWFTQWTDYTGDAVSDDALLTYCRCFYFGE